MKAILFFTLVISAMSITGCAVEATRHGNFMQIKGWGAKSAAWEDDAGHKFEITKEEPIKVPNLVPLRS